MAAPQRAMEEVQSTGAVPGAGREARGRSRTPGSRKVRVHSQSTPRPAPARFCTKEAEELSQLVLEEHGGGSLCFMHKRSLVGRVDGRQLASSSYTGIRRHAVHWLTKAFADHDLRDEWIVATLALLDRLAVARSLKAGSSAKCGPQAEVTLEVRAEWLAAALCVLKLSSAEAELETMSLKELIYKLSDCPKRQWCELWELVIKAEFSILRTLEYNVAVPSAADLADRIVLDVVAAARRDHACWPGLATEQLPAPRPELAAPVARFSLLVSFLVEFGLAHAQDAVYRASAPPMALALVAVELALHAFGVAPPSLIAILEAAGRETLLAEQEHLGKELLEPLELALRDTWATPPGSSKVVSKWAARAETFSHGPLPTAPAELPCRAGQAEPPLKTPERTPRRRSSPPTTGAVPRRPVQLLHRLSNVKPNDPSAPASTAELKIEVINQEPAMDPLPEAVAAATASDEESSESSGEELSKDEMEECSALDAAVDAAVEKAAKPPVDRPAVEEDAVMVAKPPVGRPPVGKVAAVAKRQVDRPAVEKSCQLFQKVDELLANAIGSANCVYSQPTMPRWSRHTGLLGPGGLLGGPAEQTTRPPLAAANTSGENLLKRGRNGDEARGPLVARKLREEMMGTWLIFKGSASNKGTMIGKASIGATHQQCKIQLNHKDAENLRIEGGGNSPVLAALASGNTYVLVAQTEVPGTKRSGQKLKSLTWALSSQEDRKFCWLRPSDPFVQMVELDYNRPKQALPSLCEVQTKTVYAPSYEDSEDVPLRSRKRRRRVASESEERGPATSGKKKVPSSSNKENVSKNKENVANPMQAFCRPKLRTKGVNQRPLADKIQS